METIYTIFNPLNNEIYIAFTEINDAQEYVKEMKLTDDLDLEIHETTLFFNLIEANV